MKKILEAFVIGILTGLITFIATQHLPNNLQFIVETKIIWAVPAFLLAFSVPLKKRQTDAIAVSITTLLTTGLTFYLTEIIKLGNNFYFPEKAAQFVFIAVVFGAVIGYLAFLGHSATNQLIRYGSLSILPAIFTGDGINEIIQTINHFELTPEICIKTIGGIVFYILISGSHKFKKKSIIVFSVLAINAALFYLIMI